MADRPFGACVYTMRMARVNVYLSDDLAASAREHGLNISGITQEALRRHLAAERVDRWLDDVVAARPLRIGHEAVEDAIAVAKEELEHRD